ncbi:MAG: sigma 54-interacting transcriptional regulator [Halioglobus sp.]
MHAEQLFRESAIAQFVVDPLEDRVVAANQEACRLMAMDATALQGKTVSQLFAPCFPLLVGFTQEVLATGRGWRDDLIIDINGQEKKVEINARSSLDGEDSRLHISVQCLKELDQRREKSDAHKHYLSGIGHWSRVSRIFQEFENENQLLLEAAGEGIYGIDAKGITNFVNPAAERILGYSAEEMAGHNMHSMVHHSHADGSHFEVKECPIYCAFRDGTVHNVEDDVFWSKSGEPIDVEYTSTPIRDNGSIIGAVVVFRDVSQKKAYKKAMLEALEEVKTLKNRLELENAYLQEEINSGFNHHRIIGSSPPLEQIMQQIHLVAPTMATVLINGESGTGKELIARAIHESSERSDRSMIRVNCAAIPTELFESEFFGHVKGAFSGATSDRTGRFELADGGTIFLDEVGEIPLHLQSKLLRVLQEQEFERVGEAATRKVDVRIIAATNRSLKQLVATGSFREDLYFRLNVFPIESTPLRERREDIPQLTQHFLHKAATRANKHGLRIPAREMEKLKTYDWPGNVRELENVIERQVILVRGQILRFDTLVVTTTTALFSDTETEEPEVLTELEIKQLERSNILRALSQTDGQVFGKGGAAALLEIKPTTLSSRMKKYRIPPRRGAAI